VVPNKRLITPLDEKSVPALRVVPEKAPLGVTRCLPNYAPRAFIGAFSGTTVAKMKRQQTLRQILMQTILVLNSKGGSGKTTVATNLASFFSSTDTPVAIIDYDIQGSSLIWRSLRADHYPPIHVVNASKPKTGVTRSWQLSIPSGTERIILDAPAGVNRMMLQDIVKKTDVILIPVIPSPIDIHATSTFVKDLLLLGNVRQRGIEIGVVANRVRRDTLLYEPFKKFLHSLGISFISTLTDTDNYLEATERGIGIFEMDEESVAMERLQWKPITEWLARCARVEGKTYSVASPMTAIG